MPRRGKNAVRAFVAPATRLALCRANSPFSMVARPLGFQNTASPPPSSATALWPIPTARAPTGNNRNSPPAFWVPSGTIAWAERRSDTAADSRTAKATPRSLERLRLIDQHDGDVVLDRVDQPARVAHQLLGGRLAVLQWAFALGTDKDVEEVGREAHVRAYPKRCSDGPSRRHRGSTLTWRSRYTCWPTSVSILARAACPSALMVRPPSPMTMPFWLSRSTNRVARIYTGLADSRNSSIAHATL